MTKSRARSRGKKRIYGNGWESCKEDLSLLLHILVYITAVISTESHRFGIFFVIFSSWPCPEEAVMAQEPKPKEKTCPSGWRTLHPGV